MKLVLTLLVRNEVDIVHANVAFHLNAGVDLIIATDHASRDGTTEILESYAREGYVRLMREEGEEIHQSRWVTRMARLAATEHAADWVLNGDADEFWWPRGGSLKEVLAAVPERYGIVYAIVRSFVPRPDDDRSFAERMTARLATPAPINDTATPFRPVSKVAHRGDPKAAVAPGNHDVHGIDRARFGWSPIELLHFPLRSREQSARKHDTTLRAWRVNVRGDLARARMLSEHGGSRSFYDRMVVDDAALERGLVHSSLVSDTRLRDALRLLAGRTPLPADGRALFPPPSIPGRLVFPRPTIVDDAAFAVDAALLREADVVRALRHLDELEQRIASLERRSSRRLGELLGRGAFTNRAARIRR